MSSVTLSARADACVFTGELVGDAVPVHSAAHGCCLVVESYLTCLLEELAESECNHGT